jgi:hypothetical protein
MVRACGRRLENRREVKKCALGSGDVLWSDQDSVGSRTTVTMSGEVYLNAAESGDALWSDQESVGGRSMVEQ